MRERIRYAIDNALARGVWVIMLWMAVGLVGAVILVGLMIWALDAGPEDQPVSLLEGIWIALTRSLDPGTFGQDTGPHFRVATLVITIIGLLAVALLIGLIANAVDRRLTELRQGRSIVLESRHTLVLGVNSKLPLVVRELIEARPGKDRPAIVILAPCDKVELEQTLKREIPKGHVRVVVRRGEPSSLAELSQGRPELARNIVILRPDDGDADAEAIKVALAVCRSRSGLPRIPVVVELQDPDVARGLRQALSGEVITVVQSEVVARVAAQTSRAAGLGTLYQELLDFDGDELYLSPLPASLIGRPFCDALLASDTCSVLGVMKQSGESILCPGLDHRLEAGDELVVIAADEGAITFRLSVPSLAIQQDDRLILRPPARERLLIIGWNSMAARIAAEIDQHVAAGSEFRILLDPEAADSFDPAALVALEHQRIQIQHGSMIDRSAIAEALAHGPFDHVVVLCPHERLSPLQADAHALLALLHIRNVLQDIDLDGVCTNVVTEVMTVDAVDLAQVARPDDYIVSQRLVSLLIAQLAEDDRRKPVIHEILSARGAQLLLYPVEDCELVGERHFEEIILRMLPLGAVAIGWRARSYVDHSLALHGGIRVNPRKDESVTLFPGDHVIVLHRGS